MDTLVDLQFAADVEATLDAEDVHRWVAHVIHATDWQGGNEVCLRIVNREEIQALNNTYRGKNTATNVLSFANERVEGLPADADASLGDLAICAEVVEEEAEQQGKPPISHWTHLVIHGVLHLMGYDHEEESDAEQMEALETRLLADLGIADPYAESR